MILRKVTIGIIFSLCVVIAVFASSAIAGNDGSDLVVTYGETTYNNPEYMDSVNDYFASKGYSNLENAKVEIIDVGQVNAISQGISGKTYDANQIFSSALLDLNNGNNLTVTVDSSEVNLVTARMYASALESSGINKGSVFVTSPVSATGESALTGIMACYEKATNVTIPDDVKQAANDEIYTQSEIVQNNNVSADNVSQVVDDVKNNITDLNVTSYDDILNIVNETVHKYGMNISNDDIEKLADAIFKTFSVQDQANNYKTELDKVASNIAQ